MNEAHIASQMLARHSPLFTLESGQSGLEIYTSQRDAADAGYRSEADAELCTEQGIDAYIATGRLAHGQPLPPKRGPMPKDADVKARVASKLKKQGWLSDLCPALGNRGAGERSD